MTLLKQGRTTGAATPGQALAILAQRAAHSRFLPAGVVTALLAALTVLPSIQSHYASRFDSPSWNREYDTYLLHSGLLRAPHFEDTFRWWTGPWVAGDTVRFYRPLTSLLFWSEWKLFGDSEWLYIIPTTAAHVVAAVLFARLAYDLAQRDAVGWPVAVALTAGWLFSGFMVGARSEDVHAVVFSWQNQPDSFAAIFSIAAMLCYIRAPVGRGWLAGAVVCYLGACGFKESAVPLPAICLALEAQPFGLPVSRSSLGRIATIGTAALAFVTIRQLAIGGMGHTSGSNEAWFSRTTLHLFGPFSALALGQWSGSVAAALGFTVGLLTMRRHSPSPAGRAPPHRKRRSSAIEWGSAAALILIGWAAVGCVYRMQVERLAPQTIFSLEAWCTGLVLLLDPRGDASLYPPLLALACVAMLWAHHRRVLWLGFAWTAAYLIPTAFTAGMQHRYYLPEVGYSLIGAQAVGVALRTLADRRYARREASPAETERQP